MPFEKKVLLGFFN